MNMMLPSFAPFITPPPGAPLEIATAYTMLLFPTLYFLFVKGPATSDAEGHHLTAVFDIVRSTPLDINVKPRILVNSYYCLHQLIRGLNPPRTLANSVT